MDLVECLGWYPFQHAALLSSAQRQWLLRRNLEGAIWFRTNISQVWNAVSLLAHFPPCVSGHLDRNIGAPTKAKHGTYIRSLIEEPAGGGFVVARGHCELRWGRVLNLRDGLEALSASIFVVGVRIEKR